MVSSGVVAIVLAVLAQAAYGNILPCSCAGPAPIGPVVLPSVCPSFRGVPGVAFEEGCCPGKVIEKKFIVNRPALQNYFYQVPTFSKKCFTQAAGVTKKVIPSFFQTAPVCETQKTIIKVPTTDIVSTEQPLCKKTCTTSEYIIQIPIVETTCTSSPLCRKVVRTQDNLLTTVAQKTSCANQICSQNKIVQQPIFQTLCQGFQGAINKVGTKTVFRPEVFKQCVQLPPYKCLKPVPVSAPCGTFFGGVAPAAPFFPGASFPTAPASFLPSAPVFSSPTPSLCPCA